MSLESYNPESMVDDFRKEISFEAVYFLNRGSEFIKDLSERSYEICCGAVRRFRNYSSGVAGFFEMPGW